MKFRDSSYNPPAAAPAAMTTGEYLRARYMAPNAAMAERLRSVARDIFTDTFAHLYEHAPFQAFCEERYGAGGTMARDLHDPAIVWRVAVVEGDPVGYAKLTPLRAPLDDADAKTMELQQLYVHRTWHGSGIADELMKWALATARSASMSRIALTVFDHNERAKRFYRRYGFAEVGRCTFTLGDRIDDDRIWLRVL